MVSVITSLLPRSRVPYPFPPPQRQSPPSLCVCLHSLPQWNHNHRSVCLHVNEGISKSASTFLTMALRPLPMFAMFCLLNKLLDSHLLLQEPFLSVTQPPQPSLHSATTVTESLACNVSHLPIFSSDLCTYSM